MILGMLFATTFPSHASSLTLKGLLEHIAPAGGTIERTYLQTRDSTMLTESVRVMGTIRYRYPGYLHKVGGGTDGAQTVTVVGDIVHVEREGERVAFPLDRFRVLKTLMLLLDSMAQADAERLREHFRVELGGSIEEWSLLLESRQSIGSDPDRIRPPQGRIELEVLGRGDQIRRIVLESSDSGRVTFEFPGE